MEGEEFAYLLRRFFFGTCTFNNNTSSFAEKNLSLQLDDVIISGAPIHHQDCKYIQALRERGIPVEFERQGLEHPPPYPGKAFVIGGSTAQGLEAKITIYVPEIMRISEEKTSNGTSSATNPDSETEEGLNRETTPGQALENSSQTTRTGDTCSKTICAKAEELDKKRLLERRLRDLGSWNRGYLHQVASRSLSHLIVFHI
ncbi:hypothetical protein BaRGS_00040577 [Batillaria attramentaria]|uniref:Uncharacterized protein n=1 Tax=Batillaria attramentaria TaxID=370345 RepID=A0ABD0IZK6_9CAEN